MQAERGEKGPLLGSSGCTRGAGGVPSKGRRLQGWRGSRSHLVVPALRLGESCARTDGNGGVCVGGFPCGKARRAVGG